MSNGVDELLERVRSRRKLPPKSERRLIRKAANVSLRDIAVALGVSHTAVQKWEDGATPREPLKNDYARLLEELKRVAA
jgi:DNA-binding transcriptional regulator YiaG